MPFDVGSFVREADASQMPGEKLERIGTFLRLEPLILEPVVDDRVSELKFAGLGAERHPQQRLELLARRTEQAATPIPLESQDEAGANGRGGSDSFCISGQRR